MVSSPSLRNPWHLWISALAPIPCLNCDGKTGRPPNLPDETST